MRQKSLLATVLPVSFLLGSLGLGLLASSLGGCGNSGTSTTGAGGGGAGGSAGDCFDYTSFDGTSPTVTFKADVLPIFRQSCGLSTSCHGDPNGGSLPGQHFYGPSLNDPAPSDSDIASILAGSVGQASAEDPDMDVIKAGDPANSFLMYKLDGDPNAADGVSCKTLTCSKDMSCQTTMPQGGPQLTADTRDTIRR